MSERRRADLLQMVTHDQKKDIINIYTSMPWAPLYEEVAKLRVQRRTGQLFVLPKAASGEDEPQLATVDDADATRTSAGTSVQNARFFGSVLEGGDDRLDIRTEFRNRHRGRA